MLLLLFRSWRLHVCKEKLTRPFEGKR